MLVTADGPAMTDACSNVGHSENVAANYSVHFLDNIVMEMGTTSPFCKNLSVAGCDHPDVMFALLHEFRQNSSECYKANLQHLLSAQTPSQYNTWWLATGLTKQIIFSGLCHSLGVPNIFVMDLMHLTALNDPDLLLGLWHGMAKCYQPDTKDSCDWKNMGIPGQDCCNGYAILALLIWPGASKPCQEN